MTHTFDLDDDERVTAGDALALIGEVEPSALKLVGDLMEYNARSLEWVFEQLYLGEKNAHEETKERLAALKRRVRLMEGRIMWLMGFDLHEDES